MSERTDTREDATSAGNSSPRPRPATPLTGPRPRAAAPTDAAPTDVGPEDTSAQPTRPRPQQAQSQSQEAEPHEAESGEAESGEAEPGEAESEGRARRAMRWLLASKSDPDAEASDQSKAEQSEPEPEATEPASEAPRARPGPRPAAPAKDAAPAEATETTEAPETENVSDATESAAPARPRPGGSPSDAPVELTKDERPASPRPSPRGAEAAETSDEPEPSAAYDASDPEADARMARFMAARQPEADNTAGKDWIAGADRDESEADKPSLINRLLHRGKTASAATATAVAADAANRKTADAGDSTRSDSTAGEAKPSDDRDGDDEKAKNSKAGGRSRKRLIRLAIFVVIIVGVALLVRTYVAAPYYIPSASMEPTLHGCMNCNDDHVIVDKFSYRLHEPEQTDIVVFGRPPSLLTDESVLIKRVVAVPGDTIALRGGKVVVNGKALNESYLNQTYLARQCRERGQSAGTFNTFNSRNRWKIPKGELFVMGDNRCDSMDSRAFGPIKESSVIGRAVAIVWPLKRLRTL